MCTRTLQVLAGILCLCAGVKAVGEPCSDTAPVIPCGAGLYCDTTATPKTCKAILAENAECSTTIQCPSTQYCNTATPKKCANRPAGKEDCDANMKCLEDFTCETTCKVSPGKTCSVEDDSTPCTADHMCQDDVCKAKVNQACSDSVSCVKDHTCEENFCKANAGTSCSAPTDCVANYWCVFGSCIKTPAVNGACDAISDPCKNGQQCVDSKCLAEVTRGEDCSSTKPCIVTDYCKASKCAERPVADGVCSESIPCATSAYCKTQKCMAYATVSEACTDTDCSPELYCQASDKKCAARPTVNQACAATKPCPEGLKCVDSKCLVEVKAGFSCVHATRTCSTADDLVCVSGMCKARAKAGETCSNDGECQAEMKCEGGKCTSAGQSVIPFMWAVLVAFLVTFIGKTQL